MSKITITPSVVHVDMEGDDYILALDADYKIKLNGYQAAVLAQRLTTELTTPKGSNTTVESFKAQESKYKKT